MSSSSRGLRSARERCAQTLWFEGLGLVLVTPLYSGYSGAPLGSSLLLLAVLSVVMMGWSALFNTAFDLAELSVFGRVASDRPSRWRLIHAVAHEGSVVVLTCPLIYALGDHSLDSAFEADLMLTLAYVAYGYSFHAVFDRLRPVRVAAHVDPDPLRGVPSC